jgi:hypothetical protein
VVLDSYADTRAEVEYELASYFLVSNGRDGLGSGWRSAPGDWWEGYDVRLGAPRGRRYQWRGLLRRDFEGGFVLVNQPGGAATSVDLGPGASDPAGESRLSMVLHAAQGAVVQTSGGPAARSRRARTRTLVRPVPNPRLRRVAAARLAGDRLRRAVLVQGRVRRAPRGGRVVLRLERRAGGSWDAVRAGSAPIGRSGRFNRLFRGLRAGRYRIIAVYPGSRRAHGSAAARAFTLRR